MPVIDDRTSIRSLLERRAREDGEWPYLRWEGEPLALAALDRRVNRLAGGLGKLGIGAGDRVALMLANHPDHVATFFALVKLGATMVPVNLQQRGPGLEYLLRHAEPRAVIAEAVFASPLRAALEGAATALVVWRGGGEALGAARSVDLATVDGDEAAPVGTADRQHPVSISYTSGTTGPPKGVLVTDTMLRAAAFAAGTLADVRDGDRLFLWEPLYHIGGSQVLVLALQRRITLAMVEGFSARRFWDQVRAAGATHVHYLGGVLPILLKQPVRPDDAEHAVRVAWGGGAPPHLWAEFERRFRVRVREGYGMTEASSLTTLNLDGRPGSVGRPAPYFEVRVVDEAGRPLGAGQVGELLVREREPGLITAGYFKDPAATARALQGGWLHTGDLGSCDEDGFFYFAGRKKEMIRRGGENVSAWEVERVVNAHPLVEESAAIGVEAEVGEQEIKLFLRLAPGARLDPAGVLDWCEPRLARFQLPRYVAFLDAFPKTPTERIRKEALSRSVADCWDRARAAPAPGRGVDRDPGAGTGALA